jgi:hypothetical protein
MKYLLIWSFVVNHHWVAGSYPFSSLQECSEAREIILSYKVVSHHDYIVCTLLEEDNKNFRHPVKFTKHEIERQLAKDLQ